LVVTEGVEPSTAAL